VLDRARDDVVSPVAVREEHALERVVVRLTPAAREHDLVRIAAEERCDLGTGALHRRLCRRTGPVVRGRVPEELGQERPHRLDDLGRERGAGVEVEIDPLLGHG